MPEGIVRERPVHGAKHQQLQPPGWPAPKGYANGIKARGEFVFVGGMVGWDANEKFPKGFVPQAKQALDRLRKLCAGQGRDPQAEKQFEKLTRGGERMDALQKQLGAAISAITGKAEERAAASLFSLGGTQTGRGNAAGLEDFEVVAYLAILPPAAPA